MDETCGFLIDSEEGGSFEYLQRDTQCPNILGILTFF